MIDTSVRQHWMSVLAHSPASELRALWRPLGLEPAYRLVRAPEVGLIQVQGRMGGEGQRFLMGDVTVTRAVVRLDEPDGAGYGYSYVLGRDMAHAELSAVIDALLQSSRHELLQARLIAPLHAQQTARRRRRAREIAASQVDFFTLVRGEDA
ncbi:phosphonate C-P lyase system protein PhnG [Affinibrenneria salicis]|uniref:Phosphonate C-P lyase system protein PhnG n=1 Tax=Affinibrenneria salicis TaxID=2590031 RepID=A0A5J5FY24_9GAMM|nr:phosphonate C-P lyase system protein PhnG [Affinibrenneria salicis]KAA8999015.1 phosphonate C-P lyase system protein PhnG [Affinibrenneria salicis]